MYTYLCICIHIWFVGHCFQRMIKIYKQTHILRHLAGLAQSTGPRCNHLTRMDDHLGRSFPGETTTEPSTRLTSLPTLVSKNLTTFCCPNRLGTSPQSPCSSFGLGHFLVLVLPKLLFVSVAFPSLLDSPVVCTWIKLCLLGIAGSGGLVLC